jgi:SAM-dependent methyltransferase
MAGDQEILPAYSALARVYDRWTAENDYKSWAAFIDAKFAESPSPVHRVLDLCCGTGILTDLLIGQGYELTGLDGSGQMLDAARSRLGERATLVQGELPDIPLSDVFDGAICTFDSLNYLVEEGMVAALFASAARVLRPGALFVFDVNTRLKLEELFASTHYGDDQGEFAYVWRNRYDPATHRSRFLITLFVRAADRFVRSEEHHEQRWFSRRELEETAAAAGFDVTGVYDDYRDKPGDTTTMRETWVLCRRPGDA